MANQNIITQAKKGTRIYNQDENIFYIHLGNGKWQRDNEFTSQWRRRDKQGTGELNFGLTGKPGAPTIGSDGSFSITEMGFVISNKSNPEIADNLRSQNKARVAARDKLKIEKAKSSNERLYKNTNKWIDDEVTFLQKKYPNVTRDLLEQAYKSKDPAKFLSERNLTIGRKDKGHVNASIFTQMKNLENLEKTLNINQPKPVEYKKPELKPTYSQNERGGSNELTVNNKSKVVSDTNLSNTLQVNPGDQIAMANTSKSNNSNKIKSNDKVQQHRFSWEKDLDSKDAKKLQDIRNVFGDYRNELNASKKAKGSKANRKKLTGPMNQHTAEMLGLL
tara:strand:+ start:211 stop:1212 length:1002 start_codon:yes stop_codon:yes gene_type:complete